MKKVLVTGANGFIGSWLLRELIKYGVYVLAVVKNEKSNLASIANLPNIRIIYADMSEIKKIAQKIMDRDIAVFYHLAWEGSTGQQRADYNLQLLNTRYTLDAVNAAASLGCKRFVGAGTLAEFDCNAYIMKDNSRPLPVSCYGSAKIASHFMSKAECNRLGMEHIWAYFSNTYGEGNQTQNFVNLASNIMLSGKRAAFTTGEQLYDFVYAADNAHALYLLGEKGKAFCAYYIGSTKPEPLKNFICKIRDAIDPAIPLYLGEVNFSGVMHSASVFDCSQLVKDTGYQPKVSFEDGIKRTVAWLREERSNK
ncbi:MAG: nucleoside-diphosphate-sugar epimerase [Firmicutes bacterium]|nr:nucleoside-diphosphate-sugar epimerase [Bacillota bacterium]